MKPTDIFNTHFIATAHFLNNSSYHREEKIEPYVDILNRLNFQRFEVRTPEGAFFQPSDLVWTFCPFDQEIDVYLTNFLEYSARNLFHISNPRETHLIGHELACRLLNERSKTLFYDEQNCRRLSETTMMFLISNFMFHKMLEVFSPILKDVFSLSWKRSGQVNANIFNFDVDILTKDQKMNLEAIFVPGDRLLFVTEVPASGLFKKIANKESLFKPLANLFLEQIAPNGIVHSHPDQFFILSKMIRTYATSVLLKEFFESKEYRLKQAFGSNTSH